MKSCENCRCGCWQMCDNEYGRYPVVSCYLCDDCGGDEPSSILEDEWVETAERCEHFEQNPPTDQLIDVTAGTLSASPMSEQELYDTSIIRARYSTDDEIQRSIETLIKTVGIHEVLAALCRHTNEDRLRMFIDTYNNYRYYNDK